MAIERAAYGLKEIKFAATHTLTLSCSVKMTSGFILIFSNNCFNFHTMAENRG